MKRTEWGCGSRSWPGAALAGSCWNCCLKTVTRCIRLAPADTDTSSPIQF